MKRALLFASAFLLLVTGTKAQEIDIEILDFVQNQIDTITVGRFDPSYVIAPERRWMVFMSANGGFNKFDMNVPFPSITNETDFDPAYPDIQELSTYKFRLHQGIKSIGLGLCYGILRAQYGFNIGDKMERQFNLEVLGSSIGCFVDYHHSTKMRGSQYDALDGMLYRVFDPYPNPEHPTDDVMNMFTTGITSGRNDHYTFHTQLHYVFNHRRLSYSAARTASRIQKKSAGSPIMLADFFQSRAKFEDSILAGENETFNAWKLSLGAGYAYSYTPNAGKVLLHASLIPSVTLVSSANYDTHPVSLEDYIELSYILDNETDFPYASIDEFKTSDPVKYAEYAADYNASSMNETIDYITNSIGDRSKFTVNCTARLAATWNINERYVLGAYCSYHFNHYVNKYDFRLMEHNLSGYVFLGYRF